MDRESLQPLSGFRDYNKPTKDWVISQLRTVFRKFGYQALETPALERQEILLGKLGEENQKLLYMFEDNGQRKVGLRYDLTVPLSRFVAANYQQLPLPFKRYEIGPVWRAERPQKGRYRQFTQADVDILGDKDSVSSEKELIMVIAESGKALSLNWQIRLNDRRLVKEIFDALTFPEELRMKALIIIDKKDKVEESQLKTELKELGLNESQLEQVSKVFLRAGGINNLDGLVNANSENILRLLSLKDFAKILSTTVEIDLSMVRGLDYYTGTIIECVLPNAAGSLVGGGRYDSLIEQLIGEKLPAIGISFGVDRIADYWDEKMATNSYSGTIFVANLPENREEVAKWVAQLRGQGKNIELYLNESVETGAQIKYAVKRGYKEIYIPRVEDWTQGKIIKKNLETGEQEAISREEIK